MPWQVGGYTTEGEKPFDQGSFGTVWRARRLSDGARVALKLVLLTETDDAKDRIAAERHGAMLQQRFEQAHGMVPTVYDYGHDSDGHLFIAMELVEGGALADLIKSGPLPPLVAAAHAVSVCTFLERAHQFATTVEGEPVRPAGSRGFETGARANRSVRCGEGSRLRDRQGSGQDDPGHHEQLGDVSLRISRAPRTRPRQRARRFLVAWRHSLRNDRQPSSVSRARSQPESARTRHPHERAARTAAALLPARTVRHRQQAARLSSGAAVSTRGSNPFRSRAVPRRRETGGGERVRNACDDADRTDDGEAHDRGARGCRSSDRPAADAAAGGRRHAGCSRTNGRAAPQSSRVHPARAVDGRAPDARGHRHNGRSRVGRGGAVPRRHRHHRAQHDRRERGGLRGHSRGEHARRRPEAARQRAAREPSRRRWPTTSSPITGGRNRRCRRASGNWRSNRSAGPCNCRPQTNSSLPSC